jgi:hypothetical protein
MFSFLHVEIQFSQHRLGNRLSYQWYVVFALCQTSDAKTVSFHFWILYSTPVSNISMDTVSRQRNNKEAGDMSNTTDPMDLTDKWEHPASSSRAHVPLHTSEHSPGKSKDGHKTSLSEFKKTEITPSIFSDHKGKQETSQLHGNLKTQYWTTIGSKKSIGKLETIASQTKLRAAYMENYGIR